MTSYLSTRGQSPALSFEDVAIAGPAIDGGLYVPAQLPVFAPHEILALAGLPYPELALRIVRPFIGDAISETTLRAILTDSYKDFRHAAVAPLKQLSHNEWLLELFHGPTLAFKDFALQFLGRVMDHILSKRAQHATVIGATSGDTGSAAIAAFHGRKNMRIFILHPKGRTSDIQRRQMTTVADANVFNIAVEGTFDDCQDIVKALFADAEFRQSQNPVAVNSINWVRILAQVVYYFYAALALGAPLRPVSFAVPTGNFGDIYAGYVARAMGLPIEQLIIATNRNDILARCLETGVYGMDGVTPTLSPSMDIQVSSNFERLLFDLFERDGSAVADSMHRFRTEKKITLPPPALARFRQMFASHAVNDAQTKQTIAEVYRSTGEIVDPHTAVGIAAGRHYSLSLGERAGVRETPLIALATAHPAKFPQAVKEAIGQAPQLPAFLAGLEKREERFKTLPAGIADTKRYIVQTS